MQPQPEAFNSQLTTNEGCYSSKQNHNGSFHFYVAAHLLQAWTHQSEEVLFSSQDQSEREICPDYKALKACQLRLVRLESAKTMNYNREIPFKLNVKSYISK